MLPELTTEQIERFWKKVDRSRGEDACWLWTGAIAQRTGYGVFTENGSRTGKKTTNSAHRWAYFLSCGEQPGELFVCHSCDNRKCVNPRHLWLGTRIDNARDCVKKGRQARGLTQGKYTKPDSYPVGENHWKAKLTSELVVEIRNRHRSGESIAHLSSTYGVTKGTVHRIVKRIAWKHVP